MHSPPRSLRDSDATGELRSWWMPLIAATQSSKRLRLPQVPEWPAGVVDR